MNHHHDPTGELLRFLIVHFVICLGILAAVIIILESYFK